MKLRHVTQRRPRVAGDTSSSETVAFGASLLPAFEPGTYTLTATQTVSVSTDDSPATYDYQATADLVIQGARFAVNPASVLTCFPGAGSNGSAAGLLPYVVLADPTLPWTYVDGSANNSGSRLALMLVGSLDLPSCPTPTQDTLGNMLVPPPGTWFPYGTLIAGEVANQTVTYVDMPAAVFAALAPTQADLAYLAHVREVIPVGGTPEFQSVVVSNRIPTSDDTFTAYLVSLDGYGPALPDASGALPNPLTPDAAPSCYRLAVLAQWNFVTSDMGLDFGSVAGGLNQGFDKNIDATLQWPLNSEFPADLATIVKLGFVPVPHSLRQGSSTVSFYRGPLVPPQPGADAQDDAYTSPSTLTNPDTLLRCDPDTASLDVSQSAAWQLGQLLATASGQLLNAFNVLTQAEAQQSAQLQQRAVLTKRLGLDRSSGERVREQVASRLAQVLTHYAHRNEGARR